MLKWVKRKWSNFSRLPSYTTSAPFERISTLVITDSNFQLEKIASYPLGNAYNLLQVDLSVTPQNEDNTDGSRVLVIYNHYNINKRYEKLVLLLDTFPLESEIDKMCNTILRRIPMFKTLDYTLLTSKRELDILPRIIMLLKESPMCVNIIDDIWSNISSYLIAGDETKLHLLRLISLRTQKFTIVFT